MVLLTDNLRPRLVHGGNTLQLNEVGLLNQTDKEDVHSAMPVPSFPYRNCSELSLIHIGTIAIFMSLL